MKIITSYEQLAEIVGFKVRTTTIYPYGRIVVAGYWSEDSAQLTYDFEDGRMYVTSITIFVRGAKCKEINEEFIFAIKEVKNE